MMRVLLGGVGYRNLRDHSCGALFADRLAARRWPPHVVAEDVSYNPLAVVQRLQDEPPDRRFGLAVIAGALQRPGSPPGMLRIYRWDNALPEAGEIHAAITEAVTGIIALDNTLIVARHFDALPRTVVVMEIEPDAHEFGTDLTPAVAEALDEAITIAVRLTQQPRLAEELPAGALTYGRQRHSGVVFAHVNDVKP